MTNGSENRATLWYHRPRWWGVGLGIILALSDTLLATTLGFSFEINGQRATFLTAVYFSSSFALLGFLLGYVIEERRRDRRAAAIIEEQTRTISQTRSRLAQSEKLAALGQLAATIAHEVRNPLAVIRSAAQGLGELVPADSDDARKSSQFIMTEIDRLNSVITSLLTFARPPQLQARAVPVRDLLDRAALLAREELAAKQVHLQRRTASENATVQADADLISQVLLCLLSNAAEAAPRGEIVLDATAVGSSVEIDVVDSGPGVPPDLRERIFEPFFTTRSRGTGLGLAIARQIVEAHGGRLTVTDGERGGARFAVVLPSAAAAIAA
jgi:two-component system sensor histidine kinase HydH